MRYVFGFRVFVLVAGLVSLPGCYMDSRIEMPTVVAAAPTCVNLASAPAGTYCQYASLYSDPTMYGSGTEASPFEICSPYQLNAIGTNPSLLTRRFKLTADIDMSCLPANHNRIGTTELAFRGVFEGNGKTIRGWTYEDASSDDVGLFGWAEGGSIRDLTLTNANVTGRQGVGIAVGRSDSAHVVRVVTSGRVTGDTWVGGVVGRTELGAIEQVGSSATASGRNEVGGVVGSGGTPLIVSSYFTGVVSSSGTNTAGIIGYAGFGYVLNSYSTGTISSTGPNVGGIAGSGGGSFRNSYASGSISGTTEVGGLVGNSTASLWNSFSIASVSGVAGSLTNVGYLRGSGSGSMTNSYYWSDASCDADSGTLGIQSCGTMSQGTQAAATSFQNMNVEPLASWDFQGESTVGTSDVWSLPANSYPIAWSLDPSSTAGIPFFTGSGTFDDPYVISTVGEFNLIGSNPRWMSAHFKLGANLDFAGGNAKPIGTWVAPYSGTFDGDGHSISNFVISYPTTPFTGLFGVVLHPGHVKNLTLVNGQVTGQLFSAMLIGHSTADVDNVVAAGTVSVGYHGGGLIGLARVPGTISDASISVLFDMPSGSAAGGLVGNNGTVIRRSIAAATMTGGGNYVGGISGFMTTNAIVMDSMSSGSIGNASGNRVGGLVGYLASGSRIERSYSTAMVRGLSYTGGLVGQIVSAASTVTDSFSTGDVRGNGGATLVGPLVGQSAGTILNSYANAASFCDSQNAVGVQACNTSYSATVAVADFYDPANTPLTSWDFVTTWQSDLMSLPVLR